MSGVRLCIHRSAHSIGGNCIEIVAPAGERILLDAGRPLDTPDDEPTPIPPTLDTATPVLGVLLSHAHTDHCGLLDTLPDTWPVYCGKATEVLLHLMAALRMGTIRQTCQHWESRKSFCIGPFTIKPYLIDHSAFDAYALQIDVAGKTIFYSGDFRAHGRKAVLTQNLITYPPKKVDALLMEGTNLAPQGAPLKPTPTESELEEDFVNLFRKSKGRVFVSWSSTNIDRTVTLYRACKRSGRVLVPDLFCAMVLMRLKDFGKIPQPDWDGGHMRVVVTSRMIYLAERLGEPTLVERLKKQRAAMGASALLQTPEKWVIMARSSLVGDYRHKEVVPDENDIWVWSQWQGYLKEQSTQKMKDYFAPCKMEYIHSSGHASPDVLRQFAEAMRPEMLIPVHGEAWDLHKNLFSSVNRLPNGRWISLNPFYLRGEKMVIQKLNEKFESKRGVSGGYPKAMRYIVTQKTNSSVELLVEDVDLDSDDFWRYVDPWAFAVFDEVHEKLNIRPSIKIATRKPGDKEKPKFEALRRRLSYLSVNNGINITLMSGKIDEKLYTLDELANRHGEVVREDFNIRGDEDTPGRLEKDFQTYLFGKGLYANNKDNVRTNERLALLGKDFLKIKSRGLIVEREFPTGAFIGEVKEVNTPPAKAGGFV